MNYDFKSRIEEIYLIPFYGFQIKYCRTYTYVANDNLMSLKFRTSDM